MLPNVMPISMTDRHRIDKFPTPYNSEISPYTEIDDFSKAIQNEIQLKRRFKLRPAKVIFVGDVSVGKTTIVNRFCYDKFQSKYKATIGVDFEIENFTILGQNYSLEMWDTAGQERFKCIAQAYYRNARIIVVVFDMSKIDTLNSATTWLQSALAVNSIEKPLIFLVGTKSDLLSMEDFRHIEKLAAEIAEGIRAEYWTVSSSSGFKVVEFFQRIVALSFEIAMKETLVEQEHIRRASSVEMQKKFQPAVKKQSFCSC